MADFNLAVNRTLEKEGGYVNDPSDSGGETKFGISKKAFPNEDIKNLTIERAKELYHLHYWRPIKGDQIKNQYLADAIFDFAVNAGVSTAVKLVQRGGLLDQDGIMGEKTLAFINSCEEKDFLAGYALIKFARYIKICEENPSQKKYFFGWAKRAMPLDIYLTI